MKHGTLVKILQEQVQPALGCTEPVAIALACAKGARLLGGEVRNIAVSASKGLFKNAHGVGIPKTDEKGILIAAALGAVAGDPDLGLQVLKNVQMEDVDNAKKLVRAGLVSAKFVNEPQGVYVESKVETANGEAIVRIDGQHNNISYIEVNGQIVHQQHVGQKVTNVGYNLKDFPLNDIIAGAAGLKPEDISFLLEGIAINKRIAEYGIKNRVGLGIGGGLALLQEKNVLGCDIIDQVKTMVAAASDARMGGVDLPVMTSCGSGNQGIVAIMPVAMMAEKLGKREVATARALAISHLVNVYVKEHLGKLSPICGCSVSAGLGATAAITWLLGGSFEQISGAMKSIIANLSGMICDGAKGSCSFKLATSAGEAIICAYLAINNIYIHAAQGIVEESLEGTIQNLSMISKKGMEKTDEAILDILLQRVS
ncbi:serine dehydratase subunit alpha family protein [Zhaonella formicivorans]|uniref:L-cysteine desulfidase family protein n=1 Tax=Zhaonella formicivorans TaxID=2528593 RepID=UPI0010DCCCA5|nr:L-serine ammonia-lyase, iron-sulfur-dependent, subunit alpha [Zhaonella formicivorans]